MGAFGAGIFGAGIFGIGEADTPVLVPRPPVPRHRAPGPLLCRVINPRGEWAYLNMHGRTSGLSYTWGTSGGPLSAQVSVDAPSDANIPALTQGASFEIIRGASVGWVGRVASIAKGNPWRVDVDGLGGLATREVAKRTGTLTQIVQASIDDGFDWTMKTGSFTGASWDTEDVPITTTLDEVLATALARVGLRWTVSNQGVLSSVPDPGSTPTLLVRVTDPSIPTGINKYATRVTVYFDNSGSGGTPDQVTVINHDAEEKFGRVPAYVTLGHGGSSWSTAYATNVGNAYLARVSPRLTLTGSFTVTNGQITTATGAPVDLANVSDISGRLARLQFATPLRDVQLGSLTSFDVQLGEVTYDDDQAELSIAPVDSDLTPAQIMFGANRGGDADPKTRRVL